MTKTFLHFTILFIVLVLIQVLVFNHLTLWGMAVPLVFIYYVISLPVTLSPSVTMILSFLIGAAVDILSDTPGLNALACTLAAALRLPILKLYFPREEDMAVPVPSLKTMGTAAYLKYSFTFTLLYCLLYFAIDTLSFHDIWRTLMKTVITTLLTFTIMISFEALLNRSSDRK